MLKFKKSITGNKLFKVLSKIVGILNLSPESFSGDGKSYSEDELKSKIENLIFDGADIIDVGAESTAPGSPDINEEEELKRLKIFFEILSNEKFYKKIDFSLDTRRSNIAKEGIKNGIKIINDVSGGRFDENMFDIIATTGVYYVLMYCKNVDGKASISSNNLEENNQDILKSIIPFFEKQIIKANKKGIKNDKIILDPGMGAFLSNDYNDSIKVLQSINKIKKYFNLPIFIGTSRKGFLGKILNCYGLNKFQENRLGASISSSFFAGISGADYIRIHDINEFKQFITIWNTLLK